MAPNNKSIVEHRTMTTLEAKPLVLHAAVNVKRPIFLWGPPGIGKSELVAEIGAELDALVIDLRMALLDPTDVRGIGYYNPAENALCWAQSVDLPTKETASKYKHVLLFLDELNSAPPAVQASAYQLILNRRVGQYVLPDNVSIIAAGNREGDKGVTYRMPAPLANRFVHFELRSDFDAWLAWAINHNINSDIIGYLSEHKNDLFSFDPNSSSRAFATPRSWAFLSDLLTGANLTDRQIADLIAGTVGEGLVEKFRGHLKWTGKLPKAADIISGKVKTLDVTDISACYTLAINIAYELKNFIDNDPKSSKGLGPKNRASDEFTEVASNAIEYIFKNLTPELNILTFAMLIKTYQLPLDGVMTKSKVWPEWRAKYIKYLSAANSK